MITHSLRLQALKILAAVARADHDVDPRESQYLLAVADELGASEHDVDQLRRTLIDDGSLPGIDYHALSQHRTEILHAVDELIQIDERIVSDERVAREAIAKLLGGS